MSKLPEKQRIGVTEAGEVAFALDVFDHLYAGNIIITKRLSTQVIDKLVENKDKCILHLTVTGHGGDILEPLVPRAEATRKKFNELMEKGFPIDHVVLRIDPVVPTPVGLAKAMKVVALFKDSGIKRVRISLLDMYNHVKKRFKEAGLKDPYNTFHAPYSDRTYVYDRFVEAGNKYGFEVECCGEPGIASVPCLSHKDIDILGLTGQIELVGSAEQRNSCRCPANKHELIRNKPQRCKHHCLYCFWRDDETKENS